MRSASPLQGALLPLPSLPSPTACWPHGCYYTSSMLYLETWHSLFPWPGSWDGEIILDYPSGSSVIKRPITKERKREITAREEGKAMWWWKWTLSWCGHKSRNVGSHQSWERQGRVSPNPPEGTSPADALSLVPKTLFRLVSSRAAR